MDNQTLSAVRNATTSTEPQLPRVHVYGNMGAQIGAGGGFTLTFNVSGETIKHPVATAEGFAKEIGSQWERRSNGRPAYKTSTIVSNSVQIWPDGQNRAQDGSNVTTGRGFELVLEVKGTLNLTLKDGRTVHTDAVVYVLHPSAAMPLMAGEDGRIREARRNQAAAPAAAPAKPVEVVQALPF